MGETSDVVPTQWTSLTRLHKASHLSNQYAISLPLALDTNDKKLAHGISFTIRHLAGSIGENVGSETSGG